LGVDNIRHNKLAGNPFSYRKKRRESLVRRIIERRDTKRAGDIMFGTVKEVVRKEEREKSEEEGKKG